MTTTVTPSITGSTSTVGPRSIAALLAAAAAVAIVAAHVARPDFDPSWTPISDLALGAGGWVMTLGFILWALAGFAAALTLRPLVHGWAGWLGLVLLGLAACGPLVAAIFPADPVTVPTNTATLQGAVHGIGALLSDALLPATVILTVHLTRAGRRLQDIRPRLVAATITLWLAALWLTLQMATYLSTPGATLGPETTVGWANRLHVAACLIVFAVFGSRTTRPIRSQTEQ